MELWIRSQDKDSLIKPQKIELIYDYLCGEDIQLIHIETDKGRIGSYSTKERALEVLDEIQSILMPKIMAYNPLVESKEDYQNHNMKTELVGYTTEYDVFALQTYVYEMPKE